MTFGYYEHERRRRRRVVWAWIRAAIALAILGITGIFSYQFGVEQTNSHEHQLRADAERLSAQNIQLTTMLARTQRQLIDAEAKTVDLERRYEQNIPSGDVAHLVGQVREQLATGVPIARLSLLLANAAVKPRCDPIETKRIVVQVPLTPQTANLIARFGNGAVTIAITGQPARARDGAAPEAWFDPAQPVAVRITPIGGRNESTQTGHLPINYTLVSSHIEWRLTIANAARSFVDVTAERCPLP